MREIELLVPVPLVVFSRAACHRKGTDGVEQVAAEALPAGV
jgi:hypothetical protein